MADVRFGAPGFFDRGLDRVVEQRPAFTLPDAAGSAPLVDKSLSVVGDLVRARNLDSMLEDGAAPAHVDPVALTPSGFRGGLSTALAHLAELAQNENGGAAAGRVFHAAAQVIADEIDLRDLIDVHRLSLLQG